jgi:hypothetical protein
MALTPISPNVVGRAYRASPRKPPMPSPSPDARRPAGAAGQPNQLSGLAADLARNNLFQKMRSKCRTPGRDASPPGSMFASALRSPVQPLVMSCATTPSPASVGAAMGASSGRRSQAPPWSGTPARKLREEAAKLRDMSRLNSPALQARAHEAQNGAAERFAMAAELADTRARLESAEGALRLMQTPAQMRAMAAALAVEAEVAPTPSTGTNGAAPAPAASTPGSAAPSLSSRPAGTPAAPVIIGAAIPTSGKVPSAAVTVVVRLARNNIPAAEEIKNTRVSLQKSASRSGSVISQLRKVSPAFASASALVHRTAEGWTRVSRADELSDGEHCWLLFDASDRQLLPGATTAITAAAAAVPSTDGSSQLLTPLAPSSRQQQQQQGIGGAMSTPGAGGSLTPGTAGLMVVGELQNTVRQQQLQMAEMQRQLQASQQALDDECEYREAAETRVFQAYEELARYMGTNTEKLRVAGSPSTPSNDQQGSELHSSAELAHFATTPGLPITGFTPPVPVLTTDAGTDDLAPTMLYQSAGSLATVLKGSVLLSEQHVQQAWSKTLVGRLSAILGSSKQPTAEWKRQYLLSTACTPCCSMAISRAREGLRCLRISHP